MKKIVFGLALVVAATTSYVAFSADGLGDGDGKKKKNKKECNSNSNGKSCCKSKQGCEMKKEAQPAQ